MARALLLIVSGVLVPVAAAAQAPPPTLTLEDALELAGTHNPALRRAHNDQGANEAATLQAWGGLLPRVSAGTTFSLGSSTTLTGQDAYGRPVALDEPESFRNSSAAQRIGADITLFDGGRSLRNVSAARAQELAGEARIRAEERRVEAAVTRAFYQALRAERVVTLERTLLASAQDNLERTQELLRIAASKQPDVLGARIQVSVAEQNVARALGEAEKSKLTLLETIGIGEAADFALDGELPEPFDPAELDVEELVRAARQRSPAVVQAEAQARAARQRTAATKAQRWPSITASGGFSRSMNLRSYDAFLDLNPQNRGLSFTLGASLPLFTGFQTTQQVAQAHAQEQNAQEEARAAAHSAAREVRAAYVDLETAYRLLELARLQAELSRERLEMAEEEYRLGALSFLLLQQQIDQAAQAERSALDALHNFATMLVTMEERTATSLRR
jgi:outer membrane protein